MRIKSIQYQRVMRVLAFLPISVAFSFATNGQPLPQPIFKTPSAPPRSPGMDFDTKETRTSPIPALATAKQLYEIGDLSDDEQAYVEFINRARVDPAAEGIRLRDTTDPDVVGSLNFFNVNFDKMLNDPDEGFNLLPSTPVLVPNARLTAVARLHSQDMFSNTFQGHAGSNGSFARDRITAQGYTGTAVGENVFATANSAWHGHAGFNVDWGGGPGFSPSDFVDTVSIADKLKSQSDSVSAFLLSQLSSETAQFLASFTGASGQIAEMQFRFATDFARIISNAGAPVYAPERFSGVSISAKTSDLLNQNPMSHDLVGLNRWLLEDAYPTEITRTSWEPGGIQNPPGHRLSIHNGDFKEIGVGVINGSMARNPNSTTPGARDVGPQLVTQVFASRSNITPFITGVAYYDFNDNFYYDQGEGIGNVMVEVSGSNFYAVTVNSGGYGVPVPGNGTYTVMFSGEGLAETVENVVVSDGNNTKVDFIPPYSAPTVSGPVVASIGQNNSYQFTPVGSATAYQWRQSRFAPFQGVEGAETGLGDFTVKATGAYEVQTQVIRASGSYAFRLIHPTFDDQFLVWNRKFVPGASASLTFKSRLRFATETEVARVEVSADDGDSWSEVWSQAGTSDLGEQVFSEHVVELSELAGQVIQLRFTYDFLEGSAAIDDGNNPVVGWYFDDIQLNDASEILEPIVFDVTSGTVFNFVPQTEGEFTLQVRAEVSNRWLPFGPGKAVIATTGSNSNPVIRISNIQISGGQAVIAFDLVSGSASTFSVLAAPALSGIWSDDANATVSSIGGNSYIATTSVGAGRERYFLIRGE